MTECGSSIVECLRTKGIEPTASASTEKNNQVASNALIYTEEPIFHTYDYVKPWWSVDFKQRVTIFSYQIDTYNYCSHVKTWELYASNDNKRWAMVDTQPDNGFPCGRNYTMSRLISAQYIKVVKLKDSECHGDFAMMFIKFFGSIYGALPFFRCTPERKLLFNFNFIGVLVLVYS
jgi:hypothetical protein